VPVGQVIRIRAGGVQGELHLLAYVQTAAGARFTAISYWRPGQAPERHTPPPGVVHAGQFTSVDDQGTSYRFGVSLGPLRTEWSGVLDLHPNPPDEIRWLDLSTTPGEPVRRIDLNSQLAPPLEITVTPAAVSPGELLLTDIAAGFLALACPEQVPLHPSAARPGPLSRAATGSPTSSPRWRPPPRCPRPAACPASSPACARASGSVATASPRRQPATCPNRG
jgi:hypothetical protein